MKKLLFLLLLYAGTTALFANTKIDIDLTKQSSTMVFSHLFNMYTSPEAYEGKTIRIQGFFTVLKSRDETKKYFYIMLMDEMACCQNGIEFVWNGTHHFPADYPVNQTEIEITGTFGNYTEDGQTYPCIYTDHITKK